MSFFPLWRDNDPQVEPVVEIYQGDRQNYEMPGAPRSNIEGDSIGGWRPLGFVSLALHGQQHQQAEPAEQMRGDDGRVQLHGDRERAKSPL